MPSPATRASQKKSKSTLFLTSPSLAPCRNCAILASSHLSQCASSNWRFRIVLSSYAAAAHKSVRSSQAWLSCSKDPLSRVFSCSFHLDLTFCPHSTGYMSWFFLTRPLELLNLHIPATSARKLTQRHRYAESEGSNFDSGDSDEEEPRKSFSITPYPGFFLLFPS